MIDKILNDINFLTSNKLNSSLMGVIEVFYNERVAYLNYLLSAFVGNYNSLREFNSTDPKVYFAYYTLYDKVEHGLHEDEMLAHQNNAYDVLSGFGTEISTALNDLDGNLKQAQETFLFESRDSATLKTKIFRSSKKLIFDIFKNLSKDKNNYAWSRSIPLKNLFIYYYNCWLIQNISEALDSYYEQFGKSYTLVVNSLREWDLAILKTEDGTSVNQMAALEDYKIKFEELIKEEILKLSQSKEKIKNQILQLNTKAGELLNNSFLTIGTIENPGRRFNDKNIYAHKQKTLNIIEKSKQDYKNYFSAVYDRFEYYYDLLWFINSFLYNRNKIFDDEAEYSESKIAPIFEKLNSDLSATQNKINSGGKEAVKIIMAEKEELYNKIDKLFLSNVISSLNINNIKNRFSEMFDKLHSDLNEFSKDYYFVKPSGLNYVLNDSDLKMFSPKDIIDALVFNRLSGKCDKLSETYDLELAKISSSLISLGRIAEYNLLSSLSKFEEADFDVNECISISVSGIERVKNKADDLLEENNKLIETTNNDLDDTVAEILDDLLDLTNIERLITVRLQVSKEKALQRGKDKLSNYFLGGKQSTRKIIAASENAYKYLQEKFVGIKSKVGLGTVDHDLSEMILEYLSDISTKINRLPYVYQKLFADEQVSNEKMFVGREVEIEKIEKAYYFWNDNNASSVAVIGEKGSGASSLLGLALKKLNPNFPVIRREFKNTIYEEKELLIVLSEMFKLTNPGNADDLIDKLNARKEKTIVVIENLEDFFIRTVGGFSAINCLLNIITSTNKNILWTITCNIFAWKYLEKVVDINDRFMYAIKLQDLNLETLREIIIRRHNMSGYNLKMLPEESVSKQKFFIKMSPEDQQKYLENEYFTTLLNFSTNNISIALFIWLNSIVEINDEEIILKSSISTDFSFLNPIPSYKLFSLMNIILHDGLTISEHSMIFNCSKYKSSLDLSSLSEIGILFKRGEKYKINFRLYRPIIDLLKDKNILH